MTAVWEKLEEVVVREALTGKECDVCGKVHKYEPVSATLPRDGVYELRPKAAGWERFYLENTNAFWDVCPDCLPKLRAFFRRPQGALNGLVEARR